VKKYQKGLKIVVLIILIVSCNSSRGPLNEKSAVIELGGKDRILASRIFGIFSDLNENSGTAAKIYSRKQSKLIAARIKNRYMAAVADCRDVGCLAKAFVIQPDEVNTISGLFNEINLSSPSIVRSIRLHNSGYGNVFSGTDEEYIRQSLQDAFRATNYIFNIYLEGNAPRYPKIDAISFSRSDPEYFLKLKQAVEEFLKQPASGNVFFSLPMLTSLKILALNGRDEAARYEPLTGGINKEAFGGIKSTDWKQFQYSAILVPGLGPQVAGVTLDPGGARRCELAAEQFKRGVAPYIIVSGGHVHPSRTPFSEAVEMKKYLVEKLKIPVSAVIAEPYARHTTTNIRNGSRIVYLFNMPSDKAVLIVTDIFQAAYLTMMRGRFMEELGYLPYQSLNKSANGMYSYLPDSNALKINPLDPLDP